MHEASSANIKAFSIRGTGTQYVAMVTKLFIPYCGTQLVECYYKESNISDRKWLRSPFSYLIQIWSLWRHHFANLYIYV